MWEILGQYNIDIAGLSETRLSGESNMEEVGAGYTFYWIGKLEAEQNRSRICCLHIYAHLEKLPKGINIRLTIRVSLPRDRHATMICVYAPTMKHTDEIKNVFYEDLDQTISDTPKNDKLIMLGTLMLVLDVTWIYDDN